MGFLSRRAALKASALFGMGALANRSLVPKATAADPGGGGASPATPATRYGPQSATGDVAAVYQRAREVLYPVCRVCPECDGVACAGEFPGIGGLGSGMAFQNNFTGLQRVRLKTRPLSGNRQPDCSTTILGQKLSFPAMAAPIGGLAVNFPTLTRMSEDQYFEAIIGGCVDAGTLGSIGDIQSNPLSVTRSHYDVAGRFPGKVIAGIKPRPNENFISIVRLAEAARAFMITIDIDSAGRGWMDASKSTAVEPKTVAQLRELVRSTRIPIIVKGIMTPDDALLVGETGAAGICVSNHGGRVLDRQGQGQDGDSGRRLRALRDRRPPLCRPRRRCRPRRQAYLAGRTWRRPTGRRAVHEDDARRADRCDGADRGAQRGCDQSQHPRPGFPGLGRAA